MRFGVVHRLMTNALAALGVLALVSSGQFSTWVNVAVLVGLAGALSVRETWQRLPAFRHVDTIALLVVIAVQVTRYALGAVSGLDVLVEFAAALQIVRLATRRGAAHDQQVVVLALLHLIAGTVLGGGLAYGLCFAGVLLVAPGALVLSHLRREVEGNYRQGARDRTGLPVDVPRILRSRRVVGRTFLVTMCLLSVPIFVFTVALFVFFPRVGLSLLLLNRQPTTRFVGFSPRVDLGQVGMLQEDRTVVMRVRPPDIPDPPPELVVMHLRGTALDHYDGRAWTQSENNRRPDPGGGPVLVEPPRHPAGDAPVMSIELEPIDPPVVFFPPHTVAFRLEARDVVLPNQHTYAVRGPEGEFRYQTPDERGVAYKVYLARDRRASFERLDPGDRDRYLQLPSGLSQRTKDLAVLWTADARTPLERAQAIEKRLREGYKYDRNSPSGRAEQPLDHFLFESQRGHCEYYSTALAVMLRVVGVPTRNVTGFVGGQYNRFGGFYAVRQKDAHSWVEVYLDGSGWVTFDPTPPSNVAPSSGLSKPWAMLLDLLEATSQRWNQHVVGYDLKQQYELFRSFQEKKPPGVSSVGRREIVLVIGGVLVVVAVVLLVRRRKKEDQDAKSDRPARTRSMVRATALYESLESALAAHGVHRSPGTPPLRHAENLSSASHPLAPDVLDITQVYLSVRFGGMTLTDDVALDLEKRVKSLRSKDLKRPREIAP